MLKVIHFVFEVSDMALFSLAECSLAVSVLALAFSLAKDTDGPFMLVDKVDGIRRPPMEEPDITYAARF